MRKLVCSGFLLLASLQFAAAETPSVSSPDSITIEEGEQCVKTPGKLKCRWDGPCVQEGNVCQSCIGGTQYQHSLGCWSCSAGTSLAKVNGDWVCQ